MAEPARELDDVSAQLGEVLRHADALLADWARFGAGVRAQVQREADLLGAAVGDAVASSVAGAVDAATARAIHTRLAAFTTELDRLEARVRATSRAIVEQRANDRRMLAGIAVGIGIAIALLAVLVLRGPARVELPAPEPIRVEAPAPPADAQMITVEPAAAPAPPAPAIDAGAIVQPAKPAKRK